MKLTHVRLLVNDFDACFRFYRDVMGFQVQWSAEGSGYAEFRGRGEAMVALFSRREMAKTLGTDDLPCDAPCQDRAMLIFEAADLDSTVTALKARGAHFISEVQERPDWGIRATYLRDPEGTLIELNSPLPQEQWSDELADEAQRYSATGQASNAAGRTDIGDTETKQ